MGRQGRRESRSPTQAPMRQPRAAGRHPFGAFTRGRTASGLREFLRKPIECGTGEALHRASGGTPSQDWISGRSTRLVAQARDRMGRTLCLGLIHPQGGCVQSPGPPRSGPNPNGIAAPAQGWRAAPTLGPRDPSGKTPTGFWRPLGVRQGRPQPRCGWEPWLRHLPG